MLTILGLAEVQRLCCPVPGREYQQDIAVLSSLWRRTWRLVPDNIVQEFVFRIRGVCEIKSGNGQSGQGLFRKCDVAGDPVAHLTPFRIVSGWRVGICERDYIRETTI